jgi:hypothetical protein
MPSHLDFLLALDEHLTEHHLECVRQPHELYDIAERAGLNALRGDRSAARWTGQLIHLGYVVWGSEWAATSIQFRAGRGARMT